MSKKSHEKCRLNKRSVQVLPDFIPEKLKRVDPHLFFVDIDKGTHDLDGFILILALVVNEIHDVFFFDSLLTSHRIPKPEEISEFSGQWSGMRLGLWRRYIVIATEIMKATESAKGILTSGSGKEFLEYAELKSQANMTSKGAVQEPDSWGNWKALFEQSCATTRTTTGNKVKPSGIDATDFRGTLDKIRNTVAAHYDRDKGLGFGYKRFFFENAKHGGNEWAYLSDGRNLEKTRFFGSSAKSVGSRAAIARPDLTAAARTPRPLDSPMPRPTRHRAM